MIPMRTYIGLALLVLVAAGQQAPKTTPPAPGPQSASAAMPTGAPATFSTTSSLIIVDVTVKDPKTGLTIDDLTEKDFSVFEDNKPQKVAVFEHEKLSLEPEAPEPPPTL